MTATKSWEKLIAKMPILLEALRARPALIRNELAGVPQRGIYALYENNCPMYVGRSNRLRQRLLEHSRPSSPHNSATFAFLLAEEQARNSGILVEELTRETFQNDPTLGELFREAKARVSRMKVRIVEVNCPIEQAVFEVYAAMELGTIPHYNNFENH